MQYSHILSPIKVGNLMLKNRLISGNSLPHFLQGPETYPAEPLINHVAKMAQNGAAVVTFADWTLPTQRTSFNEDGKRFPMFNLDTDPSVENYICQLADQVHYYNSHISLALMPFYGPDPVYDVNDEPGMFPDMAGFPGGNAHFEGDKPGMPGGPEGMPPFAGGPEGMPPFPSGPGEPGDMLEPPEGGMPERRFGEKQEASGADNMSIATLMRGGKPGKAMSREQIREMIEIYAQRAKRYKDLGFDMVTLHFAYRLTLFARFISPRTNHRTDEYGGPIENRARFMLELCARIKELCGKDFPIEVQLSPEEDNGMTLEETCKLAKLAEGLVDIFQFRAGTANLNHPTGYNSVPHSKTVLDACAAVKATGTSILCEPIGGYQDIDDMEEILASGQADLIGAARAFICDFDFYEKIKTDRSEDIVPCIRCNKCHVPSLTGEWLSYCSVNPRMGIEHRLEKLTKPVSGIHKVAVVGGGPAGMRAALFAKERGYDVTLYEKTDALGGQLKIMDGASFKWPLVQYRQWLIYQLEKMKVHVALNTTPTREQLFEAGYDVILLALGAKPKTPPIPGAEKAYDVLTAFESESKMGHRCVVIGGSESGTEAGLYLAEHGHRVTILTRGDTLAPDATPIHYRETIDEFAQELDNIDYIEEVTTTAIGDGYVCYRDKLGQTHRIDCDDVVALGGMASLQEEAVAYYGITPETHMIGDCFKVGNLHTCNRMAYSAVYNL